MGPIRDGTHRDGKKEKWLTRRPLKKQREGLPCGLLTCAYPNQPARHYLSFPEENRFSIQSRSSYRYIRSGKPVFEAGVDASNATIGLARRERIYCLDDEAEGRAVKGSERSGH